MGSALSEQLDKLPSYLGAHVALVSVALALGLAISLPAALLVVRTRAAPWLLALASTVQTIPSLALLALMVPLLNAFGFWPALCALVLYSALPILRNTVTGIGNVDPDLVEAAHGLGMTRGQVLRQVELPLALPVILAGVRTSTVWVVGIATLSTPVGQASLGNYIFGGLQTRNWVAVLVGCGGAALLALALDFSWSLLESAWARRSRARGYVGGVLLLSVLAGGGLAPRVSARRSQAVAPADRSKDATSEPTGSREIRVGSKTFTEQYILAAAIEKRLTTAGLRVKRVESLGSTIAFDALRKNEIDVYVDYSGTLWANGMKRSGSAPAWRVLAEVSAWLATTHGIRSLGSLGFENAYALAMRRDRAEQLGVTSIRDLARQANHLSLGSDYEFFERPEWRQLRDGYGLTFEKRVSFDSTFMYEAVAQGEVDVITAFSSDGRIAAYDLVVLEDPARAFPPYDAMLLLAPGVAKDASVVEALQPLVGSIDVRLMRRSNLMVDREQDKRTPSQAADLLLDAGSPKSSK
ncbi:MAG: glycine betaine ABC transporter substrate-binding protein [Polyangiaceae bacterium]